MARFCRRAHGVSALALVVSYAASSSAQNCPAFEQRTEVASVSVSERIAFLDRTFDKETHDVELWSITWGSIYATTAIVQASILPFTHYDTRVDLTAGAISAGFGSALLFVLPLRVTLPLYRARRELADSDQCHWLALAENALKNGAEVQSLSSGWLAHVGNVLVNAGLALILGVGYGHWESAAISAGVGIVIGETNVFTEPHRLSARLAQYRSGQWNSDTAPALRAWHVAPVAVAQGAGVGFMIDL